jgi:hypothetical protein
MSKDNLIGDIGFGLIGGVVGTIAMDLVMLGVFALMGMPADTFFSFIGAAAGGFLSMIDVTVRGIVALGAAIHYFLGPFLGLVFSLGVARVGALRVDTMKRAVALGVLYTEVVSILLLAPGVIILRMAASEIVQLFGLALVFHLVYGAFLGGVVGFRRTRRLPLPSRLDV